MATKKVTIKLLGFPVASAKLLADMITGKVKFEKWKAIYAAMEISTYLMGCVADVYSFKGLKAAKIPKKTVAATLKDLADQADKVSAASIDIPMWLLPILMKLILTWIEGSYPEPGKKNGK